MAQPENESGLLVPDTGPALRAGQTVELRLELAHVFLAWHTLCYRFSDLNSRDDLDDAQRRAVWLLEDALGAALVEAGLGEFGADTEAELVRRSAAYLLR